MQVLVQGDGRGAVGFSTGLQYVPGVYAKPNELIELARIAANEGGIYATHMRNEGTNIEASVTESIRLARRVDMPLEISHLKIDSPSRWGSAPDVLKLIDDARTLGLKVQADQYAYGRRVLPVDPVSDWVSRRRRPHQARAPQRRHVDQDRKRCALPPSADSPTCHGPRWPAIRRIRRSTARPCRGRDDDDWRRLR